MSGNDDNVHTVKIDILGKMREFDLPLFSGEVLNNVALENAKDFVEGFFTAGDLTEARVKNLKPGFQGKPENFNVLLHAYREEVRALKGKGPAGGTAPKVASKLAPPPAACEPKKTKKQTIPPMAHTLPFVQLRLSLVQAKGKEDIKPTRKNVPSVKQLETLWNVFSSAWGKESKGQAVAAGVLESFKEALWMLCIASVKLADAAQSVPAEIPATFTVMRALLVQGDEALLKAAFTSAGGKFSSNTLTIRKHLLSSATVLAGEFTGFTAEAAKDLFVHGFNLLLAEALRERKMPWEQQMEAIQEQSGAKPSDDFQQMLAVYRTGDAKQLRAEISKVYQVVGAHPSASAGEVLEQAIEYASAPRRLDEDEEAALASNDPEALKALLAKMMEEREQMRVIAHAALKTLRATLNAVLTECVKKEDPRLAGKGKARRPKRIGAPDE